MSLTKNELKYYSSLLLKKYRDEENRFIVEGRKIVEDGLNSNFNLEHLFLTNEFAEANRSFFSELNSQKINLSILNNQDFKKISDTKSPQGIAAVFDKTNSNQDDLFNGEMIVCLDNISDPGNVGTIVRNCDWFGVKEILLSEDCADVYNPKTIRASMGSIFHLSILENWNLKLYFSKIEIRWYVMFMY